MNRSLTVITVLIFGFVACFGQTSFKTITPGKTSRPEAERTLGKPVKAHSQTLIEYAPQALTGKIFVQYRSDSVVERIEMLCQTPTTTCADLMKSMRMDLPNEPEKSSISETPAGSKWKYFYGSPRFIVTSGVVGETGEGATPPARLAFYSRDLYEAAGADIPTSSSLSFSSIWAPLNAQASLNGTNLTFYRGTTYESCMADCDRNAKCRGFALIRAGFYDRNDPPMCYLASAVTGASASRCCISAVKK